MPEPTVNPTETSSNIPSKQQKRLMKDAYQGRGGSAIAGTPFIAGRGGTRAKDSAARQYAATGQRQPEGEKRGFLDNLHDQAARSQKEAQQRQYAEELARQKQNEKRVASMAQGGLGRRMAMSGLGKLAGKGGAALGSNAAMLSKSGAGVNRGLGRMAEREAAMKRMNQQKRREAAREAWGHLKAGRFAEARKAASKAPKKQRGVQAQDHSKLMWGFLIGLALVKDMIDFGTLSFGSIVTWIIGVVWGFCLFFFLGKKNMGFVEQIVKSLMPALSEMVPFVNMLPILTFSVLYIWYRSEIMTKLPAKPEPKKLPG